MKIAKFNENLESEPIISVIRSLIKSIIQNIDNFKLINYKVEEYEKTIVVSFCLSIVLNEGNVDAFDKFIEFCNFWKNCNSNYWSIYNYANGLKFLIGTDSETFLEELNTFIDSKKYNL